MHICENISERDITETKSIHHSRTEQHTSKNKFECITVVFFCFTESNALNWFSSTDLLLIFLSIQKNRLLRQKRLVLPGSIEWCVVLILLLEFLHSLACRLPGLSLSLHQIFACYDQLVYIRDDGLVYLRYCLPPLDLRVKVVNNRWISVNFTVCAVKL